MSTKKFNAHQNIRIDRKKYLIQKMTVNPMLKKKKQSMIS